MVLLPLPSPALEPRPSAVLPLALILQVEGVMAPRLLLLLSLTIAVSLLIQGTDGAACEFQQDNFHLQYGVRDGMVHMRLILTGITARHTMWNAIGFGQSMYAGLDLIVFRINNGQVTVSDEYVKGFTSPWRDASQDITINSVNHLDNMVVISFRRPQFTRDHAFDAQLSGCQSWKFATGMNPMSPRGDIFHHRMTPTGRMVCIEQCRI